MVTMKPDRGYQNITVPCVNGQGAFLLERLNGTRIAIRIGKLVLFFNYAEAEKIAKGIALLMNSESTVGR